MNGTDAVDRPGDTFSLIRTRIQDVLNVSPEPELKSFGGRWEGLLRGSRIPELEKADLLKGLLEILTANSPRPKNRPLGKLLRGYNKLLGRKPKVPDCLLERVCIWEEVLKELNDELALKGYIHHEGLFKEVVGYINDGEEDVIILSGMVGVGKTLMARQVKCHFQRGSLGRFPGGVHFLQFSDEGSETPDQMLQRLSDSMKLQVDPGKDIWQSVCMATRSKQCLIILDGLRDTEVINRFRFPGHKGKLLVTSRQQNLWNSAKVFVIHPSDILAKKLDESLFLKLTSLDAIPQDVKDTILPRCGGCLRLVSEMATTLLKKTESREESLSNIPLSSEIFKEVEDCVKALPSDAQTVMAYFGLFKPGLPVPEEIIENVWTRMPCLSDAALYQIFIDAICDHNLVTRNRRERDVSYTLHPLMSEYWLTGRVSLGQVNSRWLMLCRESHRLPVEYLNPKLRNQP